MTCHLFKFSVVNSQGKRNWEKFGLKSVSQCKNSKNLSMFACEHKKIFLVAIEVLGILADRAFSRQGKNEKFSRQFYHNWS